jgi:hypothetical protein
VGFIPIKLLPNDLLIYFDTTSVLVFTLFLFMNASAVLASHYLQVRTCEMQFNAQCLGKWMMYQGANPPAQQVNQSQNSQANSQNAQASNSNEEAANPQFRAEEA